MICEAEANPANSVKRLLLIVAVVCGLAAFGWSAETVVIAPILVPCQYAVRAQNIDVLVSRGHAGRP